MKKILLIHGANLNKLGARAAEHYGTISLENIENLVTNTAREKGVEVLSFQSNHEGALIDFLQRETPHVRGVIINPGAFTHYSYALHDAILDSRLPAIEVHLSDIASREPWRQVSVTAPACVAQISGKMEKGYLEALDLLITKL